MFNRIKTLFLIVILAAAIFFAAAYFNVAQKLNVFSKLYAIDRIVREDYMQTIIPLMNMKNILCHIRATVVVWVSLLCPLRIPAF